MAEDAQLMLATEPSKRLEPVGSADLRALSRTVNAFADQRDSLRKDVELRVQQAKQSIEEEKNRLAALMSELTQSVVVCNLDGRILLYNNRAKLQFKAMSDAPQVAGGGELIGLGRSIYTVLERNLIVHALESLQHRLRKSAAQPVTNFVTTTRAGQLLRVQMAPVLNAREEGERALTGFILMLDNITRTFESETRRDQLLHSITEGNRAALANVRAAAEMLDYDDLEPALRLRFRKVIKDEVNAMSKRIDEAATAFTDTVKTRWPLEEMLATDLIAAVRKQLESRADVPVKLEDVDETLWVRVDSFRCSRRSPIWAAVSQKSSGFARCGCASPGPGGWRIWT